MAAEAFVRSGLHQKFTKSFRPIFARSFPDKFGKMVRDAFGRKVRAGDEWFERAPGSGSRRTFRPSSKCHEAVTEVSNPFEIISAT